MLESEFQIGNSGFIKVFIDVNASKKVLWLCKVRSSLWLALTSIYKLYFRGPPPAQAALQQIPSVARREGREGREGRWPGIEQLTLIAYKPQN